MSSILDFWPIESPPRPNQVKALEWLEQQEDTKYIILEAPVGSGKSLIGLTYSRYLSNKKGDAFILTPQRILQQQYERTLSDRSLASLYGKNNYPCSQKNTTCDIGSIVKPKCSGCKFSHAFTAAKKAPNTVFNYKLALLLFGYTKAFHAQRSLMVLDECHTVEEHLTEFNAITVNHRRAERYGVKWKTKTTIPSALKWIKEEYMPKASDFLTKLFEKVKPLLDKAEDEELTRAELKQFADYNRHESHLDDLAEFLCNPLEQIKDEFVLVHDKETMKFKQLTGAKNFRTMLDPRAGQFLFMSSTILNYKGFCKDLGIDPSQAAYLSIESDFPVENRPVIYLPQMKMNASWNKPENKKNREKMLAAVLKLLEHHKNESGIIHTGNFQIARWLVDELMLAAPQHIVHHNPDSGDDRNEIINMFTNAKKPIVLISPSITEGLDLKDDMARFAIFAKVPFGFLGDQWIKRRLEMSQEWYQRRALINVIQGGGRVVRSQKDWGNVYILDASWAYLYSQTKNMIPKWWRDSYQIL